MLRELYPLSQFPTGSNFPYQYKSFLSRDAITSLMSINGMFVRIYKIEAKTVLRHTEILSSVASARAVSLGS